jgi:hypothetical protein
MKIFDTNLFEIIFRWIRIIYVYLSTRFSKNIIVISNTFCYIFLIREFICVNKKVEKYYDKKVQNI